MKFIERFKKIEGINKAIYIPRDLHLTIFYNEKVKRDLIKKRVLGVIRNSNFEKSVETLSFYDELNLSSDKGYGKC